MKMVEVLLLALIHRHLCQNKDYAFKTIGVEFNNFVIYIFMKFAFQNKGENG